MAPRAVGPTMRGMSDGRKQSTCFESVILYPSRKAAGQPATMEIEVRFETTKGMFITADTKADAARMAAQYNMGEIARVVQAAPSAKPRRQMSVAAALRIFAQAQDWPQCGQDWPMDARQRAAQAVIAANPGCTDDIF